MRRGLVGSIYNLGSGSTGSPYGRSDALEGDEISHSGYDKVR